MVGRGCQEVRAAREFAHAASLLATEAATIAAALGGLGPSAEVARRAADSARGAAADLARVADDGIGLDEAYRAAAWAMSAAAVALTQTKESLIDRPVGRV